MKLIKWSSLVLTVLLSACGGGLGGANGAISSATEPPPPVSANPPPPVSENPPVAEPPPPVIAPVAYTELVIATDQNTVRSMLVTDTATTVLATATIPGIPGTYTRSGNTITVTMPGHQVRNGIWVELAFNAGTGGTGTSGNYKVTVVDNNSFNVTDAASGTITDGTLVRKTINTLAGTYVQTASTTVIVTVPDHGLRSYDTVDLKFTSGMGTSFNSGVNSVIDANTFTVTSQVSATASGTVSVSLGTNYTAMDAVMHPSGKWVYVSSQYDCYRGSPYCWGGDLISRFAIDWFTGALTFEKSFRTTDNAAPYAVPVKLEFNASGTRLVHKDNNLTGLRLWSVDLTSGDITHIADSGGSSHWGDGLAFSADGSLVYNGTDVFTVGTSPDSITRTTAGGGNEQLATTVVGNVLYNLNVDRSTSTLWTHSLTAPTAPVQISTIDASANVARDIAVSKSGSMVVTSGLGGLKTYTFDGAALAASTSANGELIDGGGTVWPGSGAASTRMYRSVNLNDAGTMVVSAYFTTRAPGVQQGGIAPSGYLFATVGADGALGRVRDLEIAQYARAVRFIKKPE